MPRDLYPGEICYLCNAFQILIASYVIVELLGLPVDIFNLMMVKSENSIGIAQGLTAPILNWVYMVINFIIMIAAAIYPTYIVVPQLFMDSLDLASIS